MPFTAFKPSVHGFHFVNSFSSDDILDAMNHGGVSFSLPDMNWGLCGGMSFDALDHFFQHQPIPTDTSPPPKDTSLFKELVRRQAASVNACGGISAIFGLQTEFDEEHYLDPRENLGQRTTNEWPGIKEKLDAGIPTTLLLIRAPMTDVSGIGDNHQVVAFGYSEDSDEGRVRINIYDPNYPLNNDVVIGFVLGQDGYELDAWQLPGANPRGLVRVPYDKTERGFSSVVPAVAQDNLEWLWTVLS